MHINSTVASKQANNTLLTVSDLGWVIDNKTILSNISFSIPQGSFTGLIGANGAGKSSLLRCLYRFVKPTHGLVEFNQQDIWHISASDYAKCTAVVLQESPLHFNLTVTDVVAIGLVPHKQIFSRTDKNEKEQIRHALSQVGLQNKEFESFEHLSGGEKQRVLIARAIVQAPQLLIMDEPTSHLDVKYQIQIMKLAKSLGITVIASFHDLNLACAMSDNLLVMSSGTLVSQGAPNDIVNTDLLKQVFGIHAHVSPHPFHQTPHITYHYEEEGQALDVHGSMSQTLNEDEGQVHD